MRGGKRIESPYDDLIEDIKERIKDKNSKRLEKENKLGELSNKNQDLKDNFDFILSILNRDEINDEILEVVKNSIGSYIEGKENEKRGIELEIKDLKDDIQKLSKQEKQLKEMRNQYHKDNGNLAVQNGVCPFPNHCNRRKSCTKTYCNYDECDNGHCFRRS